KRRHAIELSFALGGKHFSFPNVPLGALHGGTRLAQTGLERLLIDLRQYLSRYDLRVEVCEESRDLAGNLTADLHRDDRIDRACRGHDRGDRSLVNNGGLVLDGRSTGAAPVP